MDNFFILICARAGSKGIKKKNLVKINGKSLVGHAVSLAKKISKKNIMISSDSDEILNESLKYGANILLKRPKHLSKDNTGEIKVWKHALGYYEKKYKILPDYIISLPPTSPLRNLNDINKAIKKFKNFKYDVVLSGKKSERSPYFNIVEFKGANVQLIKKNKKIFRRQDAPTTYDLTTVCYIISTKYLKKTNYLLSGKIGLIEVPKHRAVDIDDKLDLLFARTIINKRKLHD